MIEPPSFSGRRARTSRRRQTVFLEAAEGNAPFEIALDADHNRLLVGRSQTGSMSCLARFADSGRTLPEVREAVVLLWKACPFATPVMPLFLEEFYGPLPVWNLCHFKRFA